jgi:Uma2 family endonuclease
MNRQIALLIQIVAQEWKIDCIDLGSTTFNREELKRGFEPDSCFYFQNAPQIRGKPEIDLTVDPAPELVVEIDITSPSLDKMPIYAQLGIPEVWRYTKNGISILHLENGVYQEQANSLALPFITSDALYDLLLQSVAMTGYEWLRAVQTWARQQQP